MNKKLLTVAIGAALGMVPVLSAQADVKVFGAAQVEIGQAKCGVACGPNSGNSGKPAANTDSSYVADNKRGRIGVIADEDLGNGLTGLARFEWNLDTADNADSATAVRNSADTGSTNVSTPFSARDSWVGLKHKAAGTLRLGRSGSPYKQSGVALDPWLTTTLEARNNYGMSGNRDGYGVLQAHNSFVDNGIFYTTAGNLGGAYVDAYVGTDGGDGTNGNLSAVVGWKGDIGVGLNVFGGYITDKSLHSATVDEPTAMKLGASLTVAKMHTINFQYETVDASIIGAGSDPSASYLFLNYQLKLGGLTATASYGKMEDKDGTTQQEGNYLAAGVLYNFSKTFRVHAGWRSTELENSVSGLKTQDETVYAVGMRKDF